MRKATAGRRRSFGRLEANDTGQGTSSCIGGKTARRHSFPRAPYWNPLALGLGFLLTASGAGARVWRVPSEVPTIQAGIDSAQVGDEVLVAPGTYTWTSEQATGASMLNMKAGVNLVGEAGAAATILDAELRGRVISCVDVGNQVRIEGLTIQNGFAFPPGPQNAQGGGILMTGLSEPTVAHCILRENHALGRDGAPGLGGAVFCDVATFQHCEFLDNSAGDFTSRGQGGALYCGAARVERCHFRSNVVQGDFGADGGAILGSAQIVDCVFESNIAAAFLTACGGAICGATSITSCTFRLNEASAVAGGATGGAVALGNPGGVVSGSVFIQNSARGRSSASALGGAIRAIVAATTISECVFLENTALREEPLGAGDGGAIFADQGAAVDNCTLLGNSSGIPDGVGGIWQLGGMVRTTIIAGSIGRACGGSPGPTWTCSDLFGNGSNAICGTDGGGNFSADPQFCVLDPVATGNVTIQADSPCAPGNHPDGASCGLIGAGPVGCGSVSARESTWTHVKSLFR